MPQNPDGPGPEIVAIVLAAFVGAALSALTSAIAALTDERLMALRDEGGRDGATAARLLAQRPRIRARLLSGRVLSVAVLTAFTARLVVPVAESWVVLLAVGVAALCYAVFAEIAQTVARSRAGGAALTLLRWLRPLELTLAPFAWPVEIASKLVERVVPPQPDRVPAHIAEREVEHIIEKREEEGAIPEENAQLLRNVLEFKDTVAREVMVPRTRMVAIDIATPIDEVVLRVTAEGHSRFPVYKERVDKIEGILHAKDLFQAVREKRATSLAKLLRKPVVFAAESQKIGQLLREMQSKRSHLAIVVDEFGGTSGLVTLEDILEEIVGDIQDEHDEHEQLVKELEPGTYVADARVSIHDLGAMLELPLSEHAQAEEVESLGGLVVELAGKVPSVGESVEMGELDLIVRAADERRVESVEIRRKPSTRPPPAANDAAQ